MRKQDRLFHRARKSNSNIDWANFRKFRNSVAKTIISSHKNYINNIIGSNLVENPKCFWSYVRLKRTDNIGVPTLKTGTKVCNSDIDKAEALNDHFHSVFSFQNRCRPLRGWKTRPEKERRGRPNRHHSIPAPRERGLIQPFFR